MNETVINRIVSVPPARGHRITLHRRGSTQSVELTELYQQVGRVARFLADLGARRGHRIGVLAANCLEWVLLDLAGLRLGVVIAGLEHGKFDATPELLDRYRLRFLFTDQPSDTPGVRQLTEVARAAADLDSRDVPPPVTYRPEDTTTLKFTSGSTGEPKALAATVASIDGSIGAVQEMFSHRPGDNLFVFLPLSLLQQRYWIYSALRFGHDVTVTSYADSFVALRRARPTVVMGVPAFYELARRRIEAWSERAVPTPAPTGDQLRSEASRVFGGRIRYLWTGSAPADAAMLRFYDEVGLPLYEGYGLNETCIVAKNHPGAHRVGSVGRVVRGKEVLFDEDGVISVRSAHPVNVAYAHAAPGESERVFGEDGLVRTGDLGYLDGDGFLFIRGRGDDVLVLENGRKIDVRPIEEFLRGSPAIEECVLFCPNRAALVAVVSPGPGTGDEQAIAERLAEANAAFGKDFRIRRAVVARSPFSIENGLLTSQYKPRRGDILDAYRSEVEDDSGGVYPEPVRTSSEG
ncbi:AMP-binding protein [Streptomyces sp. NPDC020898]|uniref:AMP-binding protein n=1 Tax=Streptomyces sp. NPDC020898 TaxID=3365101 RepID=UPI00379F7937